MSESSSAAPRGHVFVIAAPSGTGKTTLCGRLLARDPRLRLSVSHTTRPMRAGEVDGKHYHFVATKKDFRELTDRGVFLEHAEYNNNLYGTSLEAVEVPVAQGDDVLLEIEVQGAEQVKAKLPDACLIFLLPPNLGVLEERLRGRQTDSEEVIQHRMALVDRELAAAGHFDFAVINDDLDRAVEQVLEIVTAVRSGRAAALGTQHGRATVLDAWHAAQAQPAPRD